MNTPKLFTAIITALFFAVIYPLTAAPTLSVETVGAIKHPDFGAPVYGAGVDVALKFNKFVTGHVRALSYETDNWGGSVVDEGSLLGEARFLSSANGKFSLSGIGGVHRDFSADDWGFGIGLRGTANIYKNLSLFAQGEIRAWFKQKKDDLISAGLQLSF